jgi:hypothetical protein
MRIVLLVCLGLGFAGLEACSPREAAPPPGPPPAARLARYAEVELVADTSQLTRAEQRMLPVLVQAARLMDYAFWLEVYPSGDSLLRTVTDSATRKLLEINYGPWDRIDGDAPFVRGIGPKLSGVTYYPPGMTRQELEAAIAAGGPLADSLKSLYTVVRRDASGRLHAIPYSEVFAPAYARAIPRILEAAEMAEDSAFKRYLVLLPQSLVTGNYRQSDLAWMDSKTSGLDFIFGAIETYEDQLFGYKAAHEAYVLVKDKAWSARLARFASALPALQRGLPVPPPYKRETPGSEAELNAYDVAFVAGQANAGVKTIAINLPNDEEVQLQKGSRRLQLKNAMRAKFDRILLPIARELVATDQLASVTFDRFFENVMFHEVAHGLGIKRTLDGKGTVREALKERASALEEGKADILGLYMIQQLRARDALGPGSIDDHYVTFLASLFRSVRFGASSAHGRANVVAFNFLEKSGAYQRGDDGKYRIDSGKFADAADSLSARILRIQGDGSYDAAGALEAEFGTIGPALQADLDRLASLEIPVDIYFRQPR